jgi:hypothetical protein
MAKSRQRCFTDGSCESDGGRSPPRCNRPAAPAVFRYLLCGGTPHRPRPSPEPCRAPRVTPHPRGRMAPAGPPASTTLSLRFVLWPCRRSEKLASPEACRASRTTPRPQGACGPSRASGLRFRSRCAPSCGSAGAGPAHPPAGDLRSPFLSVSDIESFLK